MDMAKRVVHCGTGITGSAALRGVIAHPDLELVGHFVATESKIGKDSGELVGLDPVGVIATNDWDELLALEPDCLCYFGDAIGREEDSMRDICQFLERGTNVVTIANFPFGHVESADPKYREPAEKACADGQSTLFFTGIDPGWATTDLAIAALAAAGEVESVRVLELQNFVGFPADFVFKEYFGFAKPPGFEPLLITGGFLREMWAPTCRAIADALGKEIDDWEVVYETDFLDHDLETAIGTIPAGDSVVVHFELRGMCEGHPLVIVEHVDTMSDDAGLQWRKRFGPELLSYRVEIEGTPSFTLELNFDYESATSVTSMPAVNAIPVVCDHAPGIVNPLELPRYWSTNVARG